MQAKTLRRPMDQKTGGRFCLKQNDQTATYFGSTSSGKVLTPPRRRSYEQPTHHIYNINAQAGIL